MNGSPGVEDCYPGDADAAGGGGGAVGRIRINTVQTYTPNCTISPSTSPDGSSTGAVTQVPLP